MPELPDVEVYRRYLQSTALHKKIVSIDVRAPQMLQGVSSRQITGKLKGMEFEAGRRHGKYLFAMLSGDGLLYLHFGMTGFLNYYKTASEAPDHTRLVIDFDNDYHLAYSCQRKLGDIGLAANKEDFVAKRGLGPDAMDPAFGLEAFKDALSRSHGMVKSALMNQKLMAGIGNVYSDEILFQAGIHPKHKTSDLDEKALEKLFRAMRDKVLPETIDRQADPGRLPDTFITPRRHQGASCPKCSGTLASVKVSGRTAWYCTRCQT